jgi:VIT1/CCC1 family predicted Fe2+/Mn2+ transporter
MFAGAGSMAAGEYVSVSSQRDTENADLRLEERELANDPEGELAELAGIYERRGLSPALAAEVAEALSANGALEAHARDELGLADDRRARPLQAAGASALSFAVGAVLPLLAIGVFGSSIRVVICIVVTMLALAGLGALGARLGGAAELPAVVRVVFWGAVAIGVTSAIGALVGSVV